MATSPGTPTLTADQLQAIRDADAASGEDLQFCPAAWQHRRELLAYIDAQAVEMAAVVAESQKIQQHLVNVYNWQEQHGAPIPATVADRGTGI